MYGILSIYGFDRYKCHQSRHQASKRTSAAMRRPPPSGIFPSKLFSPQLDFLRPPSLRVLVRGLHVTQSFRHLGLLACSPSADSEKLALFAKS